LNPENEKLKVSWLISSVQVANQAVLDLSKTLILNGLLSHFSYEPVLTTQSFAKDVK
jgi:hypothetical protein